MSYIKHEKECFIGYPNTEKRVEKRGRRPSFLNDFEVVGFFRVFDIASQRNQYFKRYLGSKLAKFYAN